MATTSKRPKMRVQKNETLKVSNDTKQGIISPPMPDFELTVRDSVAVEMAKREKEITDLQTALNAARIAREDFLKGIVMMHADVPEGEETKYGYAPAQKKISVFKVSSLEAYRNAQQQQPAIAEEDNTGESQ